MPITSLAPGSQNVFIEDASKLEPRAGMDYFGASGSQGLQTDPYWTLAHRIHSKYDDFVNKQGVKIPIRAYYTGRAFTGDAIDAWLPIYSGGVKTNQNQWYSIRADISSQIITSKHRYYFAEWFSTNPSNPSMSDLQPELIFTYGASAIANWSGGFANIISKTPTTLTTDTTWLEKGFIAAPEGTNIIVINGIEYTVTGGFSTDTITISSTGAIGVDDVAFQAIYFQGVFPSVFDVCSSINNQVYYMDWSQRNVYISWNRNQTENLGNTIFVGTGIDDGTFSGTYTGTYDEDYQVIISSANSQVFSSAGGGNDITFDSSGYTGTIGVQNVYTIIVVADASIFTSGSSNLAAGETIVGNTSGAKAVVVSVDVIGGNDSVAVRMLTETQFVSGETVTSSASTTSPVITTNHIAWFQFLKNGVVQPVNLGAGSFLTNLLAGTAMTLGDGLKANAGNIFGHAVGDTFTLYVSGPNDTFQWRLNGGALSTATLITGSNQALGSDGISIKFNNLNGHTVGDSWTVTAYPTITRGWSNFTYTNPNRRPGQGFTILLDSNGWTMKPQEHTMLINAQAGHYYDVELKLSADLLGESVDIVRLKSEPQNKALFPYLIGYVKNQLAIISNEKTYDILGRQKLLELQQLKTLSDVVRIDFDTVDWEDADILYFKRKIYFNVPRTTEVGKGACIFVWDDYRKYWHTPQVFGKRISLLSVIDDVLVGHSYEQNESYELFTGLNDLGLFPINTKMVFPYDSSKNRYVEKSMDGIGFEGYILGNPEINWLVNADVGGCGGQERGIIAPWKTPKGLCLPQDRASLGKSALGVHGLGNDPVDVIPHFFYIKAFDNMLYYQRNIEISCSSLEQRWSLISLGTSLSAGGINNESITDPN